MFFSFTFNGIPSPVRVDGLVGDIRQVWLEKHH
jgi:hypothetical protein